MHTAITHVSTTHVLTLRRDGSHNPTILAVGSPYALAAERERHLEEAMDEADWNVEDFLSEWREELAESGVDATQAASMFPAERVAEADHQRARAAVVESYRYHVAPVRQVACTHKG